jgi:hypothetical protein
VDHWFSDARPEQTFPFHPFSWGAAVLFRPFEIEKKSKGTLLLPLGLRVNIFVTNFSSVSRLKITTGKQVSSWQPQLR